MKIEWTDDTGSSHEVAVDDATVDDHTNNLDTLGYGYRVVCKCGATMSKEKVK